MTNKPKRIILRRLSVDEISGVTVPAQTPATVALFKSADPNVAIVAAAVEFINAQPIAKMGDGDEGPISFDDARQEEIARQKRWAAQDAIWPLQDALRCSLSSIVADEKSDAAAKVALIDESLKQFSAAVASALPKAEAAVEAIAKALPDVLSARIQDSAEEKDPMGIRKNTPPANAPAGVPLEKQVADLTAERDQARTAADAAIAELETVKKAAPQADAPQLVIGGKVIAKSAMDPSLYDALIADQAERAETRLTKMASDDFGFLPGKPADKLPLLKAVDGIKDADAKTAAFDLLRKAAQALENATGTLGSDYADSLDEVSAGGDAADAYDAALSKFATENNITSAPVAVYKFNQTDEGRRLQAAMQDEAEYLDAAQ